MRAMTSPNDLASLSREDLLALLAEVQRQVAEWRAEIDQLKRGGKRQAAPCSTGTRVADPKPPGRKPGAGPVRDREAPPPEAITEPPVDVRVLLDACPACGGPLAEARVDGASTPAWPARPRPPVTPYRGWGCRGVVWGTPGRGHHPEVAPDPYGATAHRLGARVLAAAPPWPDGRGMPGRKVPAHDDGVMVTDRGHRDDARVLDGIPQPTGLAHLLRSLREVEATQRGRARDWGARLKALWQAALARWHAHRGGPMTACKVAAEALHAAITDHRRARRLKDAHHQRRLKARGWHHDRGHLWRLLADPQVEPPNHRAARALRPAVVARKVSPCAKHDRGAGALAVFTRVMRTLRHTQAVTVVEALAHLLRPPPPHHVHP